MFVFDKKGDFIKKNQIYKKKQIFINKNKEIISLLDSIKDQRIIRLYPDKYFCDLKNCYTHNQNNLYYSDSVHLSEFQINNLK